DRAIIQSFLVTDNADSARALSSRQRLLRLIQKHPDAWQVWWRLADNDLHTWHIEEGVPIEEVIAELQRTVALNPGLAPAWEHLEGVTYLRDSALNHEALTMRRRIGPYELDSYLTAEIRERSWKNLIQVETLSTLAARKVASGLEGAPGILASLLNEVPR